MEAYKKIAQNVLDFGTVTKNRTGKDTISIVGSMFEHNMSEGFPLLSTKKMGIKNISAELEFFIKGKTDNNWLKDRNCHIWDDWCNPMIIPYSNDLEVQKRMKEENDLGTIYGYQWNHFNGEYYGPNDERSFEKGNGVNQIDFVINEIKNNPTNRRFIVQAWNPLQLNQMALPPCHYGFQIIIKDGELHLLWNQRSVDTALGLPYNIASYGILLELFALECGYKAGKLIGFFGDVHIYVNHIENLKEQLKRKCYSLPTLKINNFTSIYDWTYTDSEIVNYESHPKINYEIAV